MIECLACARDAALEATTALEEYAKAGGDEGRRLEKRLEVLRHFRHAESHLAQDYPREAAAVRSLRKKFESENGVGPLRAFEVAKSLHQLAEGRECGPCPVGERPGPASAPRPISSKQEKPPRDLSTLLLAGSLASLAVAALVVLVYRKRGA